MSLLAIYMLSGLTGVGIGIATPLIPLLHIRMLFAIYASGAVVAPFITAYSLGSIVGPVSASAL